MDHILIVEDDENLGRNLKQFLEDENYQVTLVTTLQKAREQFFMSSEIPFKLVVLDWMLPDGQGIDFLKEIRGEGLVLPVIVLTARTELIDKVLGLESGANDYMTKPFEPRELVARMRAHLRAYEYKKPGSTGEDNKIVLGDLVIDEGRREVYFQKKKVDFTKMEFDFLKLLAENPGRAFSREEILNKVWGYENYPSTRTVDTHVLQLRHKLRDSLIETVRGVGYRLRYPDNKIDKDLATS